MRKVGKALLAACFVLAGCSSGPGVIVGFVVDGQSGQRLNFFEADGSQTNASDNDELTKQVYAIIDGEFIRAEPCDSGDATEENKIPMDGCFRITGVPTGAQIPIFAKYDGYESFQGKVFYPAPALEDGGDETSQVVANIRMFPRNFHADYKLFVNFNGRGINDVTVACQIRQESNTFKTDGDFLEPQNTTSAALSATSAHDDNTNSDGYATIAGTDLVMGAHYVCEAFMSNMYGSDPEANYAGRGVLSGKIEFTAGVDQPALSLRLAAESSPDEDLMYALFSNADGATDLLGNGATLKITMNRPVEVVNMTQDCQSYDIQAGGDVNGNNNPPPAPPPSNPDNNVSEQVKVSVSADGMIVTIAYLPPNPALDPQDTGTSISFNGIYLKPKGDAKLDGTVIRRIGGAGSCRGASGLAANATPLKNVRTGTQVDTINLF